MQAVRHIQSKTSEQNQIILVKKRFYT